VAHATDAVVVEPLNIAAVAARRVATLRRGSEMATIAEVVIAEAGGSRSRVTKLTTLTALPRRSAARKSGFSSCACSHSRRFSSQPI
jgi:hypothetical protein